MKFRFEGTVEEFKTVFKAGFDSNDYGAGMDFLASEEDEALLDGSPPLGVLEGEGKIVQLDPADHGGRKMTEVERERAYVSASEFFTRYAQNFGLSEEEQPNRAEIMEEFGHGRDTIPFLLLCYEYGSMQKLAGEILLPLRENGLLPIDSGEGEQAWWKWVDLLCCNVVQVSIAGFPDLQGTYDYSNRWKREALGEA
jgi:hypothetical protein